MLPPGWPVVPVPGWFASDEADGDAGLLDGVRDGGDGGELVGPPVGWAMGAGGIKS